MTHLNALRFRLGQTLAALTMLMTCLPGSAVLAAEEEQPAWSSKTLKGLSLRNIGPALMSGRCLLYTSDAADE